ncbi:thermonuclease family protein [Affinirhizobium pseudoryzae]|uniref:thermonuclease family protein n=1 Tax=Allorhizobium pseudoryzae TaxID=379684 RepID=UPI0013EB84B9|nr:thermonuclease family protein [Allorhizobium pseudoryzae]
MIVQRTLIALLLPLLPVAAYAETVVEGPVSADVVRVIDGDTLLVLARPWPQQTVEVYVRLRGIDTPELRSACAEGRQAADEVRHLLEEMASASPKVSLTKIAADKYFGRIVADVALADGRNPAREMMAAGLATHYAGKGRKNDLCIQH